MHTVSLTASQHPTALIHRHIYSSLYTLLHCTLCICEAVYQCSTLAINKDKRRIHSVNNQPIHPSFTLIFAYRPHPLTMSHQMTNTSISTNMTDSVASQTSWMPLIQPCLFNQVTRKYGSVAPDTKYSTIYGPEVCIQDPTNLEGY